MRTVEILTKLYEGEKLTNELLTLDSNYKYVYFDEDYSIPECFRIKLENGESEVLDEFWEATQWREYKEGYYEIGTIFQYKGKTLGVLISPSCDFCYFQNSKCPDSFLCDRFNRKDRIDVIFVKLPND